jgi:hypothetical protein
MMKSGTIDREAIVNSSKYKKDSVPEEFDPNKKRETQNLEDKPLDKAKLHVKEFLDAAIDLDFGRNNYRNAEF